MESCETGTPTPENSQPIFKDTPPEPISSPRPDPIQPKPSPSWPIVSEFDGRTIQLIGWRLLGILLTAITFGIGTPWAQCMVYRWEANHTIIGGRRLRFTGKGLQLLGKYLLWGLLTLITFGIYAIFLPVRFQKWYVSHLEFDDACEWDYPEERRKFSGWIIAVIPIAVVLALIPIGAAMVARPDTEKKRDPAPFYNYGYDTSGDQNDGSSPEAEPEYDPQDFYVDVQDSLSVRSGPGTEYERLRYLTRGTKVTVLYFEGNWGYIGDGWVSRDYLSQSEVMPLETEPEYQIYIEQEDPYRFLKTVPPADASLVGKWVHVDQINETESYKSTRSGVLELRADGTFVHTVYLYMKDGVFGDIWGCPGTETSGQDTPQFVGEYTFNGTTLVLNYRAEDYVEYVVIGGGIYMAKRYWNMITHQVTLQVTKQGDNLSVEGASRLPIHTDLSTGTAYPFLYAPPNAQDWNEISNVLNTYYP